MFILSNFFIFVKIKKALKHTEWGKQDFDMSILF